MNRADTPFLPDDQATSPQRRLLFDGSCETRHFCKYTYSKLDPVYRGPKASVQRIWQGVFASASGTRVRLQLNLKTKRQLYRWATVRVRVGATHSGIHLDDDSLRS